MHIIINKNYLTYNRYKVKCAVGKRGIGTKRKEGDLITPKGVYKIKFLLYRKDRVKNIRTKIKKISIKKDMGWCDDPKSKNYNKLIKRPFNYNHEKLFRKDNVYDIILVLNYNMQPTIKNKGSAIFIHCSHRTNKSTDGCIALKKKDLIYLIKNINNKTFIKI